MPIVLKLTVAVLAALPAFAATTPADCPKPPVLTCEQLLEKAAQRCPKVEAAKVPVAAPRTETKPKNVPHETPRNWLVGAGPIFQAGWGLQAFAGYQWHNGWQVQVGPNWIPRDGKVGTAPCGCDLVPCSSPAPNDWGGSASVVYRFK